MMMDKKWGHWAATLTAACILTGCGGDGNSTDTTSSTQTTTLRPSLITPGKHIIIETGADASQGTVAGDNVSQANAQDDDLSQGTVPGDEASEQDQTSPDVVLNDATDTGITADYVENAAGHQDESAAVAATQDTSTSAERRKTNHASSKKTAQKTPKAVFPNMNDSGFSATTVKFLINSIGREELFKHLNKLRETAHTTEEVTAFNKFSALISHLYDPQDKTKSSFSDFVKNLMTSPVFQRAITNQNIQIHNNPDAVPTLLSLLTQAFKLNSIPGWSLDAALEDGNFATYYAVNRDELAEDAQELQSFVDQLILFQLAKTHSHAPNANSNASGHNPKLAIADAAGFTRLSIQLTGKYEHANPGFDETIALPIFDKKTQDNISLELQAKELIFSTENLFFTLIKHQDGIWWKHSCMDITKALPEDFQHDLIMVNFSVRQPQPTM